MTGGVLFDFDGTLVDTFDDIVLSVQEMRARLGAAFLPDAQVRGHIGWGIRNLIGQTLPSSDSLRPDRLPPDSNDPPFDREEVERGLAIFREIYAREMFVHSKPYPGIRELCFDLARSGFRLAIVSNKHERFVRRMAAGLGLVDPLRVVVSAGAVPRNKPDPLMLRVAAERMDIPIARCMVVGDGVLDVQAAAAAGIPCCAVAWGLTPVETLLRLSPAHLARTTADLGAWIRATARALTGPAARR